MALSGTIKDFGLPDIFQLIGIQRKTGVLTLEQGPDRVTVKFLEGQVVGADTGTETVEDRLGRLLVRTGRITDAQLQDALRQQRKTLQRLGYLLVRSGHVSEDDLVEALRIQSTQIIYRLFRWRDGTYRFSAVENLDYDQKHFTPISSETILMEGARMIDEWPIIERRIKSPRMIPRLTELGATLQPKAEAAVGREFDLGFDLDRPEPAVERAAPPACNLSAEERVVLGLVDGKRSVDEICDLSNLGEFDTYRILSELVARGSIDQARATHEPRSRSAFRRLTTRLVSVAAHGGLALVCLYSLATLSANPFTPWQLGRDSSAADALRFYASQARLERIEMAIQVFYMDSGSFPTSPEALVGTGYLDPADLLDPWRRPYRYELNAGGYRLFGSDSAGRATPDLTVSHQFNPMERMMSAGRGSEP